MKTEQSVAHHTKPCQGLEASEFEQAVRAEILLEDEVGEEQGKEQFLGNKQQRPGQGLVLKNVAVEEQTDEKHHVDDRYGVLAQAHQLVESPIAMKGKEGEYGAHAHPYGSNRR